MSSFDYLQSCPRNVSRQPMLVTPAHLGAVVLLAVGEGIVGGWSRGGPAGGLVGGLIGLLVGPILAWWLWLIRRRQQGLGWTVFLGLVVQGGATLLIAAAVQRLVGVPALEVAAAVTALILAGVGLPVLMALAITREPACAARGGILGLIVAAALALGFFCLHPAPEIAGAAISLLISGWFAGAAALAIGRALLRHLRCLLIRWRSWRRLAVEDDPHAEPRLDLSDVARLWSDQLGVLLLAALRDEVEELHFESLGAICRVTLDRPGAVRRMLPLPLSAERITALLSLVPHPTRNGDEQVGRLPVRIGADTVTVSVWRKPSGLPFVVVCVFRPWTRRWPNRSRASGRTTRNTTATPRNASA